MAAEQHAIMVNFKLVKRTFVLLLSILLLLQCSVKTIIVASFFVQRDYISKTLCENRNNPQMHCHGKCFLNKQLKKEQKSTSDLATILKNMKEAVIYAQTISKNALASVNIETTGYHHDNYYMKAYSNELTNVFHPPQAS